MLFLILFVVIFGLYYKFIRPFAPKKNLTPLAVMKLKLTLSENQTPAKINSINTINAQSKCFKLQGLVL
jgi:uncharacterized membrane protein YqhA